MSTAPPYGDGSPDRPSAGSSSDHPTARPFGAAELAEIGGYRRLRQIGLGGFGDVYEVERKGLRLALKLFRAELAEDVDRKRFAREVRTLQIEHDNLVRYVDAGEAVVAGRIVHWLVMELLDGQSLRKEIESVVGALPIARACEITRQMAFGLAALHDRNVAHRDLKPENAQIGLDGRVRLLDFGLVALLDSTTITIAGPLGTLAYAAPEQIRGERLLASDIYSLGVVLYELLTGRRPHRGSVAELFHAIQSETPESPRAFNPAIPRDLEELVLRMLEKEPMDRPASAIEIAEALKPQLVIPGPLRNPRVADRSAEPRLYVRGGLKDIDAVTNACVHGYAPTGIVVGATEPAAVDRGRRTASNFACDFVADPLAYRYGFMSFPRTKILLELPYAPHDDDDHARTRLRPYEAAELRDRGRCRDLVRAVLSWQDEKAATRLLAPSFPIRSSDDPWIRVNAALLDSAVAEREVFRKPIVGQIAVTLESICSPDAQTDLINRLRRCEPDEWWLLFDPLTPPGSIDELYWAIRFARLLQETGVDAIVGRPAYMRHLPLGFGISGIEVGLGRLAGFRFSDFQRGGGPGFIPPQFEFPSLLCLLPRDVAQTLLTAEATDETHCECRACCEASTVHERLEMTAEHNAYVLHVEQRELGGIAPDERLERLATRIEAAKAVERRLRREELLSGAPLGHLRVWPDVIKRGREDFLRPARLRRRSA